MRPEELCIGDWVFINDTPRKIQAIDGVDDEIMADDELYTFCQDRVHSEDDIQPIPLTPEILEKNGFVFAGDGQMCMMFLSRPQFAEGLRFNIYVGLKRKTIEVFAAHPIEKSPNWRKSNKVYLEVCGCYVHELQHALRLCGIEKEITL